MGEREKFEIGESILKIRIRDEGKCQGDCGGPGKEVAHRIAQSEVNKKKYGEEIVHHEFNLVYSCSAENSSFNIGNNPGKVARLIKLIEELGEEYLPAKDVTEYINAEENL